MKFEIGKCYRHSGGNYSVKIVGEVNSVMWGNCLVAEENFPGQMTTLQPFGRDETSAINWEEVPEEEFMKNYC